MYLGCFSPKRNGAVHCLVAESLISCMSPPPCSGMVDFVEMGGSQPHEALTRPKAATASLADSLSSNDGASSCASSWWQRLFSAENKGDGTDIVVDEVQSDLVSVSSGPPTSAHSSDSGGVLQEHFVDITDPCFHEVVSEESSYRGQVNSESDNFHGYGHYSCSEYTIVGRWQNGLVHGSGHQAWIDGRSFDGQFQSGAFNGHGHYRCSEYAIVGHWQNGLAHGHCHQAWTDGRSFDGQFQRGSFNGHGRMQWQHPRGVMVYEGEYKDDQKHGRGRFSWPSGRCYDGQWVNGQRHGVGDDIGVDGTIRRRVWEDNFVIHTMPMTEEIPPSSSLQTLEDNGSVEEDS